MSMRVASGAAAVEASEDAVDDDEDDDSLASFALLEVAAFLPDLALAGAGSGLGEPTCLRNSSKSFLLSSPP